MFNFLRGRCTLKLFGFLEIFRSMYYARKHGGVTAS